MPFLENSNEEKVSFLCDLYYCNICVLRINRIAIVN